MASRRDKKVADATTKLGRTIAGALRLWAKEVGADDIASDLMERVREGFDVVRDHAAAGKARTKARRAAKKVSKECQEGSQESSQIRQPKDDPQDDDEKEDRSQEGVSPCPLPPPQA